MEMPELRLTVKNIFDVLNFEKKWGISALQYVILEIVSIKGQLAIEIHPQLNCSYTKASNLITNLYNKGFLKRTAPIDGNGWLNSPTKKGHDIIMRIREYFANEYKI